MGCQGCWKQPKLILLLLLSPCFASPSCTPPPPQMLSGDNHPSPPRLTWFYLALKETAFPRLMLRNHLRCEQLSSFKGCSKGEALANGENNLAFNGIAHGPAQVHPISTSLGWLWVPTVGEDGSLGGFALAKALMPPQLPACSQRRAGGFLGLGRWDPASSPGCLQGRV